jgi:hypothetical protein
MLKYNLAASFRSIRRNLTFALINITGLSLGLTLIVVLMIWLQFEFSFDKFNVNADRIFRVITEYNSETDHYTFEGTPAQLVMF